MITLNRGNFNDKTRSNGAISQPALPENPSWKTHFKVETLRGLVALHPKFVNNLLERPTIGVPYGLTQNDLNDLQLISDQYSMDFQIAEALSISDEIGGQALGIATRSIDAYTQANKDLSHHPDHIPASVYQAVRVSVKSLTESVQTSSGKSSIVNQARSKSTQSVGSIASSSAHDKPSLTSSPSSVFNFEQRMTSDNSTLKVSAGDKIAKSVDLIASSTADDKASSTSSPSTVISVEQQTTSDNRAASVANEIDSVGRMPVKTIAVSDIDDSQIQPIDISGDCLFHSVHHQLHRLGKRSGDFHRSAMRLKVSSDAQIANDKTDILNFIFKDNTRYEFYASLFPTPDENTLKTKLEQYFKDQSYWQGEVTTNYLTEHSFLYYAQQFQTNVAVVSEDRDYAWVYRPDGTINYNSEAVQSDWITIVRTMGGCHFESVIIDN